ncbi:ABC transporter permease [Bacillus coahuilensis]|nr:ABC transporter permease [Bacillus coahuilensis]
MNNQTLWEKRFQAYFIEIQKYLRYMFNDHLLFVMIFAVGGGAYTYSEWIKTIPESYPGILVLAVVLSFFSTWTPFYTLLKEADKVYLLPMESRLNDYFKKSMRLSFLFPTIIQLMALLVFMPIYVRVTGEGFSAFLYLGVILMVLRLWNMFIKWSILKTQESSPEFFDTLIRYILNALTIYVMFQPSLTLIHVLILLVILGSYGITMVTSSKSKLLKWERLIAIEEQRMLRFYRVANLFTDVPHLKGQVKRRNWLSFCYQFVPYNREQSYSYLFSRSLIRSDEYFGLCVRLTLIGACLIVWNDIPVLQFFFSVLFLYLTGFQLIPLVEKNKWMIWNLIYPFPKQKMIPSFVRLVQFILFFQSIVFFFLLIILGDYSTGLLMGALNIIFSILFAQVYAPLRLKKIMK